MPYPISVMLIVNPPGDYPSWSIASKLDRAKRVLEFHDYILEYAQRGRVRWAWGSYPLYSAYFSRVSLPTYVVVFSGDADEYDVFMRNNPISHYSSFVTIPLASLVDDLEDDEKDMTEFEKLRTDEKSTLEIERVRSQFVTPPAYHLSASPEIASPPNEPTDFNQTEASGVSYLLYGVGPSGATNWTDVERKIYLEKIFWWYSFSNELIKSGNLTHGWSIAPICDVMGPANYRKGAVVVVAARDMNELTDIYRKNPVLEQSEFLSVALKPIGRQRRDDSEYFDLLKDAGS